jgi:prepilin-type N-terminal cleavage/methylation domain-containing protein
MVLSVSPPRSGFALVELIAALTLAGLVATIAIATVTRQQRFYRASAELRGTRESVRDAMEILTADIRGASVSDTVRLRTDSAIELFTAIGASVVCQTAGDEVGLPATHASGNSLSAFLTEPDTGDLALFFVDSANDGGQWKRYRIASFASRSTGAACAPGSAFASDADATSAARGFSLTVASALSTAITAGTPVRFIRRARYSLYHAGDGEWYLGYRRCDAIAPSVCGGVQPVSGPYRGYSSNTRQTGFLLEYFDSQGSPLGPTASPMLLARVDITARSESNQRNPFSRRTATIADSATVSIALRNGAR